MVESLKELNQLCQKTDYKKVGNWYVRTLLRDAALPMTWLLLHTSITANQVTLISLVIGVVGMIVLSIPGPVAFVMGALLLQSWYYLDHVDGQIARYRKTVSLTGRFLDFMTHHLIHCILFFSLGFYGYGVTKNIFFVVWGFVGSLSIILFNMIHDVKYKTFFEKISTLTTVSIRKKDISSVPGSATILKRGFALAHKLCEIHVMMNLLTLGAILQLVFKDIDFRFFLLLIYCFLAPVITVGKMAHILASRKIDVEYQDLFKDPS